MPHLHAACSNRWAARQWRRRGLEGTLIQHRYEAGDGRRCSTWQSTQRQPLWKGGERARCKRVSAIRQRMTGWGSQVRGVAMVARVEGAVVDILVAPPDSVVDRVGCHVPAMGVVTQAIRRSEQANKRARVSAQLVEAMAEHVHTCVVCNQYHTTPHHHLHHTIPPQHTHTYISCVPLTPVTKWLGFHQVAVVLEMSTWFKE